MTIEKAINVTMKVIGWFMVMTATYKIGGIWWLVFVFGLVTWLPFKYFREDK